MKGLDNQLYLMMLVISNIAAVLLLLMAIKWPRAGRLSFFLLFAWASWMNWKTCLQTPASYLEYADLAWLDWYRSIINGWFAEHIQLAVGFVATCQGLIAASMLLRGNIFRTGCIGAILFFVAILPLGVGSGFPCSAIMATAVYILMKKHGNTFIWEPLNRHGYA